MNKEDRETFAQCQGACPSCMLEGGCTLEKKLKRRKGAGLAVIIGGLVLALSLTTGTAEAKKGGTLTARRDSSGAIVYSVTPDKPKAEDWTTPGPRYDASGNLRGMVYDVGQKRGRASGSATYRTSTGQSGRVDWSTSFYCYAGQCSQ